MSNSGEAQFRRDLIALMPRLRRFGCSLAGSLDRADDLVQATCERALTRFHQWTPGTRLDSWTFAIMQSIWRNELRAQARRGTQGLGDADDLVDGRSENHLESRLILNEVDRVVAGLPEQQRAAIMLISVEGYSYREAAKILEVPIGTVMSRLARGRLALVQALDKGSEKPRRRGARHAG